MYFETFGKLKKYILLNPEGWENVTKEELEDIVFTEKEVEEYEYTGRD